MSFCPNCRYEYKEGVKECPDCGASLVEKLTDESPEGVEYIPLRSLPSRLYAEMLQEALKKEGIPSFIKSDDIAITFPSYGTTSAVEVTIWVQEQDRERAEEIANQMMDPN
jgi:transcription initiation factor TFIIIB Brf1 subunit/transcription initiation factor TFIIB